MKVRRTFQKVLPVLVVLMITTAIVTAQTPASSSRANPAEARDEVVRVDTNLVTIPATVLDRDGRYVTNLKKEDFQIFEDGIEQKVSFLTPVAAPFTVLFLLDTSGSMTYRIDDLADAANTFVSQLRPDDQLIAVSFCNRVKVLTEGTTVAELQDSKKLKLRTCGSTRLYYAVEFALKRMKKVQGRKAILLFSDGYDSGGIPDPFIPNVTAKNNLRDAEEQDSLIYTVQFDTRLSASSHSGRKKRAYETIEAGDGYMEALAQRTGGRHYHVENISDLAETFGHVADELGRQYSLGYYPKTKPEIGQHRQIKVRVLLPNLVVHFRDNYVVNKVLAQGK